MNIKKSALLTAIAGLLASLTFAAQAQSQSPAQSDTPETPTFEQLDANADGAISNDEAQDTWLADSFSQIDVNQDGYVTKAEYDAATS